MINGLLTIIINDETVLEYKKDNRLPGHQRRFLDQMDRDMDEGIDLSGQYIQNPSQVEKVSYVAMYLVNSILNSNENMTIASCAYLSHRMPELDQITASHNNDQISVELRYIGVS